MVKLLAREAGMLLISGLLGMLYIPWLLGHAPATGLGLVGLVMGLTFMPLYALAVLGGNKMPAKVRNWLGVFSWALAFSLDLFLWLGWVRTGQAGRMTATAQWITVAPGLFGLAVTGLAYLKAPRTERGEAALWALYAYSFPMVVVRWLIAWGMVRENGTLQILALQVGALYMFLRVLLRLFWPSSVEGGEGGSLVHRPVPDAVVGLVEGTLNKRARPFATLEGGATDDQAISVLVKPQEVTGAVDRVNAVLQGPFEARPGVQVGNRVEIVVRRQG